MNVPDEKIAVSPFKYVPNHSLYYLIYLERYKKSFEGVSFLHVRVAYRENEDVKTNTRGRAKYRQADTRGQ